MTYRVLADLTLVAHVAFVVFAALGGLLVLRWRRAVWPHAAALAWGVVVQLANWTCPLTPLENYFRRAGGEAGYEGGFIEHHLRAILYSESVTHELRVALGLLLLVANLLVYSYIIFRRHRAASFQRTFKR